MSPPSPADAADPAGIRRGILRRAGARVVGRRRELESIVAALAAGRHLLLEGPPGTGKSTLLRAMADERGTPFFIVEANSALTPARLVGFHDPATVLRYGYRDEDFVPGPLVEAMLQGGLLYIEELNRGLEETLNVLLGPLADGTLRIARRGVVQAAQEFRVVAAMNPFDRIGTSKISQSVNDRLLRLTIDYQSVAEETAVVRRQSHAAPAWLVESAVWMARESRHHPDVAMGASVRGAIDLVVVAEQLAGLRSVALAVADTSALDVVLDAALCALSARITPSESTSRTPEEIITELWEDRFYLRPRPATGTERLAAGIDVAVQIRRRRPPRGRGARRGAAPPGSVPDRATFRPAPLTEAPRIMSFRQARAAATGAGAAGGHLIAPAGEADADLAGALDELLDDGTAGALRRASADLTPTELRALTRRLALRIVVKLARPTRPAPPGKGVTRSVRYRFNSDDLDLDRTLDEIAGKAALAYDDFWVRERVKAPRTFALMIDASGSMRGPGLLRAAVAAAALAQALTDDDFAVVMFWRDAAIVKAAGQQRPLPGLIDDVLSVRARGLTNLRVGLEAGLRELNGSRCPVKAGIVFTDALHNLGGDPEVVARRFPRLHVIGTSPAPDRVAACQALAARGRGECVVIQSLTEIPAAVGRCLAS